MMVYNDSGQSCCLPLKPDEVKGIVGGLRQGFYQASVSRRAMIMVTTRLPYLEIEAWDVYHPRGKVRAVFFVNEVRGITEMLQNYLAAADV